VSPGGRLAAVLELLEEILRQDRPADLIAGSFLKSRRYIGSKDRRAIADRIWGLLRRRARLEWILEACGEEASPRHRLLVDLVVTDRMSPNAVGQLCGSGDRRILPLTAGETALLRRLDGRAIFHHEMPAWVRGEYPAWLESRLAGVFGERLAAEMGALRDEAPVDLRVNRLKADRATAQAALAAAGLEAQPTPWSPIGLRLAARTPLAAQAPFRDGLVEVQDEGSQLLALLTDARPGQNVVDFCAGAGGKTLALAAAMQNKGRLFACDVNQRRAERAAQRLRRAGVHNVVRHVLEGDSDKWVKRHGASFDRVLVDSPCTGSGTWRRNPDAKWRLTPAELAELVALQGRILASAARLVRGGGRLVYATCSLLRDENEDQVEAFLAGHAEFALVPVSVVWAVAVGGPCPANGPFLRLTPAQHGTDGFFAAVMERRS
jgi:16S rRNA (cytosine967-C5)-methyltransferase